MSLPLCYPPPKMKLEEPKSNGATCSPRIDPPNLTQAPASGRKSRRNGKIARLRKHRRFRHRRTPPDTCRQQILPRHPPCRKLRCLWCLIAPAPPHGRAPQSALRSLRRPIALTQPATMKSPKSSPVNKTGPIIGRTTLHLDASSSPFPCNSDYSVVHSTSATSPPGT